VKLNRILISRAPGISDPFVLDGLSQEINVVVGPNGSGKTSLCNALAATLWPSDQNLTRLEVKTVWDEEGRVLDAELLGGRVSWEEDTATVEPPSLPDSHLAPCYKLGVRDLIQESNATDIDLARQIRIQMAGGYDVPTVISNGFLVRRNFGARESKYIGELRRSVTAVQRRFGELADDEDRLRELKEQQQEAKAAEQEHRILDSAIELAGLRSEVESLDADLTSLPSELANFTGDESERIDQLEAELCACESNIESHGVELKSAAKDIEEANLDAQQPKQTDLTAWSARIDGLREREHELLNAENTEEQKEAEVKSAMVNLGWDDALGVVPNLSDEALDEVSDFIKQRDELTGRGSGLQTQLELSKPDSPTESLESLLLGAGLLRDWLSAPQTVNVKPPAWLLVAAVIGVGIGIALAYYLGAVWLALSGIGFGLAFAAMVPSVVKSAVTDDRALQVIKFEQCGLEQPGSWSRVSVSQLLLRIDQRIAKANLANKQEARFELINVQLEKFKSDEGESEKLRAQLHEQLGVDVASDLTLADLMQRYHTYRDASAELAGAEGVIKSISEKCSKIIEGVDSFLSLYGYEAEEDASGLAAQLVGLKDRLNCYNSAMTVRELAQGRLDKEEDRKEGIQGRIEEFYTGRGIANGDRDALKTMVGKYPEYKGLNQDHKQKGSQIDRLEQRLSDRAELLELTEEEANRLSAEAELESSGLSEISSEIGSVQTRLQDARDGNDLEVATANLDEALDALASLCEEAQHRAAGCFLLQDVDREHEQKSRPPVMESAAKYFRDFTRNAYELRLPDVDIPEFSARDTSAAQSLTLAQLSDGTRIQLLLAVRIAFAIDAEHGTTVPLMLDEALSTADPERFKAVAESLVVLANNGRQIFYMTSNPADVASWKLVCDGISAPEPHVIDLGQLRTGQAAVQDESMLRLPVVEEVPEPGPMDAEKYGIEIGVTPASALKPVESLHLFYLLRNDLDSLYKLLRETRLTTVGQWISLSEAGQASHFLASNICDRLDALCQCAREIYELRSVGRGKPIDGEVLRESGVVSETFIPRLTSLASDLDGDCRRFLEALEDRIDERVTGFRSDAQKRLRTYLEDNDYQDSRSKMDPVDIRLRAIGRTQPAFDSDTITREECGGFVDQLLDALDKS